MLNNRIKSLGQFFSEVKVELSKMTWPKWNEFVGATAVVFLLVLVFSIYLGGLDFVLNFALNKVFSKIFNIG